MWNGFPSNGWTIRALTSWLLTPMFQDLAAEARPGVRPALALRTRPAGAGRAADQPPGAGIRRLRRRGAGVGPDVALKPPGFESAPGGPPRPGPLTHVPART